MALSDKLITYGNLSTFYDNLKSHDLADKQDKLTAGNNVTIDENGEISVNLSEYAKTSEIPTKLTDLTNDGNFVQDANYVHTDNNYTTAEKTKLAGLENYELPQASADTLGGIKVGANLSIDWDGVLSAEDSDAIVAVDTLPAASDNKTKFYRLSTDEKVYMSINGGSTPSDSDQIDNAYFQFYVEDALVLWNYMYKGEVNIQCSNGTVTAYRWYTEDTSYFTKLSATDQVMETPYLSSFLGAEDLDLEVTYNEGTGVYSTTKTVEQVQTLINTNLASSHNVILHRLEGGYEFKAVATKDEVDGKQNTLTAGQNIDIADNTISSKGYVFDETKGSLAIKYKQDDGDGGQIVSNSATGLGAVAEGYRTQATGDYGSHAEGTDTVASGAASHAEGNKATATNNGAHAEGYRTQATGRYSHAEGTDTVASGRDAHAEGTNTTASERAAHAEGLYTDATGYSSHAEGWGLETLHNLASGGGSHVEGIGTKAINKGAHAEGYGSEQAPNTASGYGSHVEGCLTLAQNQSEHAEGSANVSHKASDNAGNAGNTQHSIGIAFGNNTGTYRKNAVEVMQNGDYYLLGVGGYDGMHIKTENGYENTKTLQDAVNSKQDTLTTGTNIDITNNTISAEGYIFDETKGAFATKFLKDEYDGSGIGTNTVSGNYGSFAEGYNNTASGEYGSHAEGFLNTVSGDSAHVEGQENTATHSSAHAEGRKTNATNNGAHSEGTYSDASGVASHVEGDGSKNYHNIASGDGSHAEGVCTRSQNKGEHAEGCSNVSHKASNTYGDAGNTQHSIGIGTHYNSTKNAVEVMQNGDMYVLGVGGYQGTDTKVQNASIGTLQEVINSKADAYETATTDEINALFI